MEKLNQAIKGGWESIENFLQNECKDESKVTAYIECARMCFERNDKTTIYNILRSATNIGAEIYGFGEGEILDTDICVVKNSGTPTNVFATPDTLMSVCDWLDNDFPEDAPHRAQTEEEFQANLKSRGLSEEEKAEIESWFK